MIQIFCLFHFCILYRVRTSVLLSFVLIYLTVECSSNCWAPDGSLGSMVELCCNPNCSKAAHSDGSPVAGFCCVKCVVKVYSYYDFERVGRGDRWWPVGQKPHSAHCCIVKPTAGRAECPVLTAAWVDKAIPSWCKKGASAAAGSRSQNEKLSV